jgi:hypothetical protein
MSEFDFLSVLVSILFGLGLAHLCSGVVQLAYRRHVTEEHLVYTGFVFVVLVLNWWVFFSWHTQQKWTFDAFLILTLWALCFYAMAITLYPPDSQAAPTFNTHHRWFLWALIVAVFFDITQSGMRGNLFALWYYLPFTLHYAVLALISIKWNNRVVRRLVAWWFLLSMTAWALVVRKFLA